jgi:hypothetical protein
VGFLTVTKIRMGWLHADQGRNRAEAGDAAGTQDKEGEKVGVEGIDRPQVPAGTAFARSVGTKNHTSPVSVVLTVPVPNAGQRWYASKKPRRFESWPPAVLPGRATRPLGRADINGDQE